MLIRAAGSRDSESGAYDTNGVLLRTDQFNTLIAPGVGHFPHEEAPAEVARQLTMPAVRMVASK